MTTTRHFVLNSNHDIVYFSYNHIFHFTINKRSVQLFQSDAQKYQSTKVHNTYFNTNIKNCFDESLTIVKIFIIIYLM